MSPKPMYDDIQSQMVGARTFLIFLSLDACDIRMGVMPGQQHQDACNGDNRGGIAHSSKTLNAKQRINCIINQEVTHSGDSRGALQVLLD